MLKICAIISCIIIAALVASPSAKSDAPSPAAAIQFLRAHPEFHAEFDARYTVFDPRNSASASQKILGNAGDITTSEKWYLDRSAVQFLKAHDAKYAEQGDSNLQYIYIIPMAAMFYIWDGLANVHLTFFESAVLTLLVLIWIGARRKHSS